MLYRIGAVLGSMAVSFFVGIQTAGDVHPLISSTMAGETVVKGDMNGSGDLDQEDARIALEIAHNLRRATDAQLERDVDGDFRITSLDALAILEIVSNR